MIIIPGALTDAARRGLVTRNVALVARARKHPIHPHALCQSFRRVSRAPLGQLVL